MAKKALIDQIIKLYSDLGGNISNVLGKRSNITFLGKGKTPEGFIDSDINIDAIGVLGKSKILEELESPMGYLTADKLNDVQAGKLKENLLKIKEVFDPEQIPNITDLRTGIRNLDQEGLGALRAEQNLADDLVKNVSEAEFDLRSNFPKASDKDIKDMLRLNIDNIDDLPPPGSRGGPDDIAAGGIMNVEDVMTMQNKGGMDFIDFVRAQGDEAGAAKLQKEVDRLNAASEAADARAAIINMPDAPAKRGAAREFLVEALKRDETDVGTAAFGKTNLNNVIDAEDVRYITEGGGGAMGDPLVLVEKYFGPRILEALPSGASNEEILIFTKRVLENVEDAAGLKPDNPRFDRFTARFIDEVQEFAKGGRVAFRGGGMDASQDDFNPPSETSTNNDPPDVGGGGDDKVSPLTINPVIESRNIPIIDKSIPTAVGLEALLKDKGRFKAVFDAEEAAKDLNLGSGAVLSYDGSIGPVDINAMTNLAGDKNLNFGYQTKGGTNVGLETDLDDNAMFKISRTFADGGRVGLRFGRAAGKAFGLFKKQQALEKGITKGYADMRKYGIEGEDITNMFKEISMDPSLVGAEKTEYFKVLNQALKNPNQFPDTIKEIQMKLGIEVGTGFKSGGLAKILEV